MKNQKIFAFFLLTFFTLSISLVSFSQPPKEEKKKKSNDRVRVVTIPISLYTKKELRENQAEEFLQADRITVEENQEEKTILSIRSVSNTPLSLAILVQDDLGTSFNLELKRIGQFIKQSSGWFKGIGRLSKWRVGSNQTKIYR